MGLQGEGRAAQGLLLPGTPAGGHFCRQQVAYKGQAHTNHRADCCPRKVGTRT